MKRFLFCAFVFLVIAIVVVFVPSKGIHFKDPKFTGMYAEEIREAMKATSLLADNGTNEQTLSTLKIAMKKVPWELRWLIPNNPYNNYGAPIPPHEILESYPEQPEDVRLRSVLNGDYVTSEVPAGLFWRLICLEVLVILVFDLYDFLVFYDLLKGSLV